MTLSSSAANTPDPISVAVYICTFGRNAPLASMIDSLAVASDFAAQKAQTGEAPPIDLGVVVVDDNPEGSAKSVLVAKAFHDFPLGLHYRHSGRGNISVARNIGVNAATDIADWVGMLDDDQIVVPEWLVEIFKTQQACNADAVTAPVYMRFEESAPNWIKKQNFADFWGTPKKADRATVEDLQTANSIISSSFLEKNPQLRFSTDLGKVGGEDMVFYRKALSLGLRAHYSRHAVSWEIEPSERATYSYQLRRSIWHGNTEALTNLRSGRASRSRLVARATKRALQAASTPVRRIQKGKAPHFRHSFAFLMQAVGMLAGAAGVKLSHQ